MRYFKIRTTLAITAVLLLSVISSTATAADYDCTDVVFGCEVAVALHLVSPGTPDGVEAKVADMSEKRLARSNSRIERAVRKYVWLVLDYKIKSKSKIFDSDSDDYLDNAAVLAILDTDATLLDVVAVGRFHTHRRSSRHTHGPAVQGPKGDTGLTGPKGDKGDKAKAKATKKDVPPVEPEPTTE